MLNFLLKIDFWPVITYRRNIQRYFELFKGGASSITWAFLILC